MKIPIPDFNWYAAQGAKLKLSPRCPIAKAELYPRYYASRWLLGENKITTKVSDEDKIRLDKKWKAFDVIVREEEPGISHASEKLSSVSNFCPEVNYDTFNVFASYLSWHTNEIDSGFAQEKQMKLKIFLPLALNVIGVKRRKIYLPIKTKLPT